MFKCTHCEAVFEHKEGRRVLRENDMCPLCHDGVLRPVECGCACHVLFDTVMACVWCPCTEEQASVCP